MNHRRSGLATWLLLATAGCTETATTPPGSADRIAALEREVAAVKAQLAAFRLKVLPDDELTDAEFEVRLKLRLDKAAPEERAMIELTERSQRKTRGWTEDDRRRYWLDRFDAERRDAAWADKIETRCVAPLRKEASVKLESFECRSERCKVVASAKEPNDVSAAVSRACGLMGRHHPDADEREPINMGFSVLDYPLDNATGSFRVTLMLVREGADMIPR